MATIPRRRRDDSRIGIVFASVQVSPSWLTSALSLSRRRVSRSQVEGLEALATMSRGSLFHIAGTGEPIFDRLSSEISASYLLGVEQRPSDSRGDRHRIDGQHRSARPGEFLWNLEADNG